MIGLMSTFWSEADILPSPTDVRIALKSGHPDSDYVIISAGWPLALGFCCVPVPTTPLEKKLRLRSIVCAARHGLPRVMLLSKVWGKRSCLSVCFLTSLPLALASRPHLHCRFYRSWWRVGFVLA